jgi:MFS transporter, DHA1 family, multidrug resistance protein
VVMCARAMARDVHEPQEAARLRSKGLSGLGVIAMLAVPLGSLATQLLSWRITLALPGVFSAMVLVVTWLKFKETNLRKNPLALQTGELLRTWRGILSHSKFWTYAMLALSSYAGLFVFLASSSFIFLQVLGHSTLVYSLVVAGMSATYIVGTFVARRVMSQRGVPGMVQLAGWITLGAALLFLGLYALGFRGAWALILPHFVYMFGHGFHQPAGQAGCTAAFPKAAGAASAMAGFLMMLVAFCVGAWLGVAMDGTVWPMVAGISFWCGVIVLTAWVLVPRYGRLES